jgi:hypothetical protein
MLSIAWMLASTCSDRLPQKDCTPTTGTDIVGVLLYALAAIAAAGFVGVWLYQRRR